MNKSINLFDKEIEIENFNIIIASDNGIEDWLYDSMNNTQYLIFNNVWESLNTKSTKNLLDLIESVFSAIAEPNPSFIFLEHLKNAGRIKEEISLLESLNRYLMSIPSSGKTPDSDENEIAKLKQKHIANIIDILKKYKESILKTTGNPSEKDLETYMKRTEQFNNTIVDFYHGLTSIIVTLSKYCSFYDSQELYYFEKQLTLLTHLFENIDNFYHRIKDFEDAAENYSNFNTIDTLIDIIADFNKKSIQNKETRDTNEKTKSFKIKNLENFYIDPYKLDAIALTPFPEISRLSSYEDVEFTLKTLLQTFNEMKEYYSLILQRIQLNTKQSIDLSNIKALIFERCEENKPLIDLINDPFRTPDTVKEFCSKLTMYESFVKSFQNIHNLISKVVSMYHKIYGRLLSITSQIFETSQSLINFNNERAKKIKYLEELMAREDQIIHNEERLLLAIESMREKAELKTAFRAYHQDVDALELQFQSKNTSENELSRLFEQFQTKHVEILKILKNTLNNKHADEEIINSYQTFILFLENILRTANIGLKHLQLSMDFTFKIEQEDARLSPVLTPVFLKKEENRWVLMDTQNLMQNGLIKEILYFTIVLTLLKTEFAKNRIFVYYFESDLSDQDRKRLNMMVKSMITQENIENIKHAIVLFFNNERVFDFRNEKIKVISIEEESEE